MKLYIIILSYMYMSVIFTLSQILIYNTIKLISVIKTKVRTCHGVITRFRICMFKNLKYNANIFQKFYNYPP